MTNTSKLIAVDFFCCAGGVTCGFKKAGIDVLGGIDIEPAYKETYETNNKGAKFIEADIAKLSPRSLHKRLGIKKNMDNLVFVGCSPCQYYTNLQTDKTRSRKSRLLLEDFKRFVDYYNPGYLFIENVPGLDTKSGSPLSKFKKFLEKKGYSFAESVVNASNYQVPQNRKRYILLASRVSKQISIPKGKSNNKITVRQAIGLIEPIQAGTKDTSDLKHWTANLEDINLLRIQNTSHNGGTRLEWKNNPALQLPCYIGKDKTFSDVYGRMHWDLPSPTITTKFYSITNGRFAHPCQNRGISLREGAILQSFPINYKFQSESLSTIAQMIGNAVPPNLAKSIGLKLARIHKPLSYGHAKKKKTG